MATDIAQLGFGIDSSPATHAAADLDRMTEAGKRAEQVATRMSVGMTAAAKKAQDAAGGLSVQTADAADKLRKMAQAASALDGPLGGIASRIRSLGALIHETSLGLALLATAAGAAVVAIVRYGVEFVDTWSDLNARVGLAIGTMEASGVVMDRLATVSRRTYSALETTAESFVRNSTTLRELGKNTAQQLDFTEALNLALVVSGAKAERATMLQEALGRAMAGGALRGQELNSVIEQGGRVAEAIAEELGVGVNQLRALGNQGKITSEIIFNAMTKRLIQFREEAEKMPATLGDGFMLIRNAFLQLIGAFDQQNKLSESVASGFVAVADSLGVLARAAIVAASSVALVFGTSIISGIYALGSAILVGAVGAMRALTVAVAANPLGALAVVIGTIISALWQFSDSTVKIGGTTLSVGGVLDAIWTTVAETIENTVFKIGALGKAIWSFVTADYAGASAQMRAIDEKNKETADKIADAWRKANVNRLAFAANMPSDVTILPSRPGSGSVAVNQSAEFDKYLASAERRAASMKIEADTYGMVESQAARYRTVMELTNLATEKGIVLSDQQSERIQKLGRDVESYTARLEGLKVIEDIRTPYEVFSDEMERLNSLLRDGALSWEQYERAAAKAAENAGLAWHQTADTIMGAIVAVAKSSGESNKTMSKIAQAAGIAQAIVNTHVGITKALASAAPPWNFALAAAVAAQGFASVAAIRSQSASVSAISVPSAPSSSTSIPSVPTATNDNTKLGQPVYINIEGEKLGYRELEELIRRINEVGADGGPITLRQSAGWA